MRVKRDSDRFTGKYSHHILSKLIIFFVCLALVCLISMFLYRSVTSLNKYSVRTMYSEWNKYDYSKVYEISSKILEKKPLNNSALTLHGYSSFYLAVSQTDPSKARDLLDESINNIRIALLGARKKLLPQLNYMLGKAYFYKDNISSYTYYADLAVKYLSKAKKLGYVADDIPEYLGLSYAALNETKNSIASFTEALLIRESDSLLMSIAEQYNKAGQFAAAKQYLYRISSTSKNDELILKSKLLLAQIYINEKDYDSAKKELELILEKDKNCADAYYELGILYEKKGNLIKARAEWRTTLHIQVNHPGALEKMAYYK